MAEYSNYNEYDEIDLDGSIEQEEKFIDLPVGDYEGVIDHCEFNRSTQEPPLNGKYVMSIFINVELDGNEVQVRKNINMIKKDEWKLSEFFLATGQKRRREALPNVRKAAQEAAGVRIRFKYDSFTPEGSDKERKYISKFYEKKASAPTTGWSGGGF